MPKSPTSNPTTRMTITHRPIGRVTKIAQGTPARPSIKPKAICVRTLSAPRAIRVWVGTMPKARRVLPGTALKTYCLVTRTATVIKLQHRCKGPSRPLHRFTLSTVLRHKEPKHFGRRVRPGWIGVRPRRIASAPCMACAVHAP